MDEKLIVGIGEILWDVFPDGPRFGGAPANFSCSAAELAGHAAHVSIISAVGRDDRGARALEALANHNVDSQYVQSKTQETGAVLVELDGSGVPSYRFAENTAWDHLTWQAQLADLAPQCDAVCFGTLGQCNETSRQTIQQFVRNTRADALRVLDINLRSPFFDDEVILSSLALANVLKLNEDELPAVTRLSNIGGTGIGPLQQLADHWHLRCIAVTRGENGALILSGAKVSQLPGINVAVANTVGAGDAYTAGVVLGMLAGRSVEEINQRAVEAATYVCKQAGATTQFPAHLRYDVQ